MFRNFSSTIAILLLAATLSSLGSCTVGVAYLIYDELKNDDPLVTWEGVVEDSSKVGVPDVVVMMQYKLETEAGADERTYQSTTDEDGKFSVEFRFSRFATYSLLLVSPDKSVRPDNYQGIYIANKNRTLPNFKFDVEDPVVKQN